MEFSDKNKKKSRKRANCDVPGCKSRMDIQSNLSFHKIPKAGVTITRVNHFGKTESVDQRKEWCRLLNIKKKEKVELFVCSLHFDQDDYSFPGSYSKRSVIRKNA